MTYELSKMNGWPTTYVHNNIKYRKQFFLNNIKTKEKYIQLLYYNVSAGPKHETVSVDGLAYCAKQWKITKK